MSRSTVRRVGALGSLLIVPGLVASCRAPLPEPLLPQVRLVLLVVGDQFSPSYLQSWRGELVGGLGRVLDSGVVFEQAFHEHSRTDTAPGHMSLASGVHPRTSGIVANSWFDTEAGEWRSAIEDGRYEQSPRNARVTSLPDWIQRRYPRSRTYVVSGKARAGIFLGGKHPRGVLWYDKWTGAFESSPYYPGTPGWLEDFEKTRGADRFFGEIWTPLDATTTAWSEPRIDTGPFGRRFPHGLGAPSISPGPSFYNAVGRTPFVDELVVDLALRLVTEERLGQREEVDYLGLSLSGLDYVGHEYGPHTQEALDTVIRLDRQLGRLLDAIDEIVGLDRTLVVLSADHGVMPRPEYLSAIEGRADAERRGPSHVRCFQRVGIELSAKVELRSSGSDRITFDTTALQAEGIDVALVIQSVRDRLARCPDVRRVWTAGELEDGGSAAESPLIERYRNGFYPGRSPDLQVQWDPFHLPLEGRGTTHQSPYDYDTHVPLVLFGANLPPRRIGERVATVDLAPTLARLVGVPTPPVDGRDLSALVWPTDPR